MSTPVDRTGGCSSGGTDYATMIDLISYSSKALLSIFVLFLDLADAYESVVCELDLGKPRHVSDSEKHACLVAISLPGDVCRS